MNAKSMLILAVLALLAAACGSTAGTATAEPTAPPPTAPPPTSTPLPSPTPTPPPDPLALGQAALDQGDLEGAVDFFNQALDAAPESPEAAGGLATAFYYQAEYENVRRVLEGRDVSRNARALEMLGRANLALAYYRPDFVLDQDALGRAADAFEQWSTLVAGDPAPYAYLAWVADLQNDGAAVARRLSQAEAISQHPVIPLVRAFQAKDRRDYAGQVEQGLAAWALLEGEPAESFERLMCARFIASGYGHQGQFQEALEWGLKELEAGPEMYGGNANLAHWYANAGQCDQAWSYAEREIELYPANSQAYYTISACAAERGDQATSFVAYREAVKRGVEDIYHWTLDLEGSAAERDLGLELSGIDLYGQKSTLYYTLTNSASVGVWFTEIEVEWPDGSQTISTGLENLNLAAGESPWTTSLANADISPGDWLRVTVRCQLHTSGDNWVELVVETVVPELESD